MAHRSPQTPPTGATLLRHLRYSRLAKLARLLDPPNAMFLDWRGLASQITGKDGSPRYGPGEIAIFDLEYRKPGGSPTMVLISDWGTANATVQNLVDCLIDIGHLSAAESILPGSTADVDPKRPVDASSRYQEGSSLAGNLAANAPHSLSSDSIQWAKDRAQRPGAGESRVVSSSTDDRSPALSETTTLQPHKQRPAGSAADHRAHEPVVSSSNPVESSELPELEPNEVTEFSYELLSCMTDSFNENPLSKGGNLVGEGGFGTVFLGRFSNGYDCAVKKLKQSVFQATDIDMLKQYRNELQMLKRLKHPNLVKLYGFSFDGPSPCLVFRYLSNGSLLAGLSPSSPLHLCWQTRVRVAQDTAQGLCYLHQEGIVHRDVKSANVLLDSDLTAQVADFGLVRAIPEGDGETHRTSLIIGTSAYMPPEAHVGKVSPKGDCFSFGVVLLELITGLAPLDSTREEIDIISHVEVAMDHHGDVQRIMDTRLATTCPPESAEAMYAIASNCLEMKKNKRPLLTQILPRLMELPLGGD